MKKRARYHGKVCNNHPELNGQRDAMAWNTPSVSPSSATEGSLLLRAAPIHGICFGQEKVRFVLAPSVSNPEFDRAGTLKQLRHSGLVKACEHRDGSSIMPERLELPSLCFETCKGDTAIVLKDGRTAVERKPPHVSELWFVQEI